MTRALPFVALGVALALECAAGCAQAPTQIVVDLEGHGGVTDAAVRVDGVEKARGELPGDGTPLTLTLLHGGGGLGPLVVEAVAYSTDRTIVARDCELVSFLARTTVRVRLELVNGVMTECPVLETDAGGVDGGDVDAATDAGDGCDPVACLLVHSSAICMDGRCVITECSSGRADCTDEINGCETDINKSLLHCGGCNQPCASGQTCHEGSCI